jgi:hypothetical protein
LKVWNTNPDRFGAQPGELGLAQCAEVSAVQLDGAVGGPVKAAEQVQVTDREDDAPALLVELAHPGWAYRRKIPRRTARPCPASYSIWELPALARHDRRLPC